MTPADRHARAEQFGLQHAAARRDDDELAEATTLGEFGHLLSTAPKQERRTLFDVFWYRAQGITQEQPDTLPIGATFRQMPLGGWDNERGDKGTLWHVRAIDGDVVIARCWWRTEQDWHYEAKSAWSLRHSFKPGVGHIYRTRSRALLAWLESRDSKGSEK